MSDTIRAILGKDVSDEDLQVFVDTAEALADELLADCGYDPDYLQRIKDYLAAHFYTHSVNRQTDSETVGAASKSAFDEGGMGLNGTTYGQTAMMLDTCGKLSEHNATIENKKRKGITCKWLGSPYQSDGTTQHHDDQKAGNS